MTDLDLLRHTLATTAYRTAKAMRGAPESFADFKAGPGTKTPVQIVAHMGDLFDLSISAVKGDRKWNEATPQAWDAECARFFESLKRFDDYLAAGFPINCDLPRLFQGPITDALTHTGQLAMLRRLSGAPMKGESYSRAEIVIGRVGYEQSPADPQFEFD